jgi:hypothetical protein
MAARDGAASVQGEVVRITPLQLDGTVDAARPVLTAEGFISASFSPEFEDGDEITEKAANGKICIQYKADDSMKGITFNISLCSPDPEAANILSGGKVLYTASPTTVVGYTSPAVGASVGNPVCVELWSKAIVNGKPAATQPYWHWVFPYVRVRFDGSREFSNGALANEFSGNGLGNDALCAVGLGTATDDFSSTNYAAALGNPFSYVRATDKPALGWSGTFNPTGSNSSVKGAVCGVVTPTGATAGIPGAFTPLGATPPANLAALQGASPAIVASPATVWTTGQYVSLGTGTAHWNGTAWTTGAKP